MALPPLCDGLVTAAEKAVKTRSEGEMPVARIWCFRSASRAIRFKKMFSEGQTAEAGLARELREVIAARHDRVLARRHEAGGCPLDLHRLVPIPGTILQLGEDVPAARHWLWRHWGTTQKLRPSWVLEENGDRRLCRLARVVCEFLSADWTPWQAILRLRRDWPTLVLAVQPHYGETDGPGDA